jgi:hypothetical protein
MTSRLFDAKVVEVQTHVRCSNGDGGKIAKTEFVLVVLSSSIFVEIEDRVKGIVSRDFVGRRSIGMKDDVFAELVVALDSDDKGTSVEMSCG